MGEPYYVATAISYPNGQPHIGHAYEAIAADVMRGASMKAMGRDVRFQGARAERARPQDGAEGPRPRASRRPNSRDENDRSFRRHGGCS